MQQKDSLPCNVKSHHCTYRKRPCLGMQCTRRLLNICCGHSRLGPAGRGGTMAALIPASAYHLENHSAIWQQPGDHCWDQAQHQIGRETCA